MSQRTKRKRRRLSSVAEPPAAVAAVAVVEEEQPTLSTRDIIKQKRKVARLLREANKAAGIETRGGHNRKTTEERLRDGSYDASRHGAQQKAEILATLPPIVPRNRKIARPTGKIVLPKEAIDMGDASDELALRNGCWFETSWADHFEQTCCTHFKLWEGKWHGEDFKFLDWQRKLRRLFGWARWDPDEGRAVRRFTKAAVWIGKKNGKSPTGAAVGWYLLLFDGEMGGKLYSAARDGTQAKIVHDHAINMRKMSPSLFHRTKHNKSTGVISHEESLSSWYLLSGDNIRSQEGLNGSVIVDEAHVVDARLERVLTDMGASRPDSLWFQISTAGEDVDTYGRVDWEYGRDVAKGEIKDDQFFYLHYGVPEGTPDADLLDPKIWRKANPAMGEVVIERKFETSLLRAKKKSAADWAAFKQRRLNMWQRGAVPGIGEDWELLGNRDLVVEDFHGMGGGLGIDASDSDDLTAAIFAVKRDGVILIWPELWITERAVEKYSHLADLEQWAEEGLIHMVEGGSIRGEDTWQPAVDKLIEEIGTDVIIADPTYCSGWLARWMESDMIVEPAQQSAKYYSAPLADLENHVSEKQIEHPGNDCLDWQFHNYLVKTYGNQRKPIKDDKKPGKKIDGVQATIMAVDALRLAGDDGACVYNDNVEVRCA
jgi:phage terminase large subunit-like protein